jgi:hypothetical protein
MRLLSVTSLSGARCSVLGAGCLVLLNVADFQKHITSNQQLATSNKQRFYLTENLYIVVDVLISPGLMIVVGKSG